MKTNNPKTQLFKGLIAMVLTFVATTLTFVLAFTIACAHADTLTANTNNLTPRSKIALVHNSTNATLSSANATLENVLTTSGTTKVYRMYNRISSEHLWTTSADEYQQLTANYWNQENVGWVCPVSSDIPVYRLYNSGLATHHYTANKGEAEILVSQLGWSYDNNGGAQFYSASKSNSSAKPVYRMYNPELAQHHYTLSKDEYDKLCANWGWKGEGVDFYAFEVGYTGTTGGGTGDGGSADGGSGGDTDGDSGDSGSGDKPTGGNEGGDDAGKSEAQAAFDSAQAKATAAQATLDTAKAELETAQADVTAKQTALKNAQDALTKAQSENTADEAAIAKGSAGFFESVGTTYATNIVNNPETTSGLTDSYTDLGATNDATSLDNMKKAIERMSKVNDYRKSVGLGELKVFDSLMAASQVQTNYASVKLGHAASNGCTYNLGENLAWGYSDPFEGWYTAEKEVFDEYYKQKTGSTTTISGAEAYAWGKANCTSNYSSVGHYLNIINPNYVYTGCGYNTKRITDGQVFTFENNAMLKNSGDTVYTFSEYYERFMTYYNKVNGVIDESYEKNVQAAQDALEASQKILEQKQTAYNTAKNASDVANKELEDAKEALEKINLTL